MGWGPNSPEPTQLNMFSVNYVKLIKHCIIASSLFSKLFLPWQVCHIVLSEIWSWEMAPVSESVTPCCNHLNNIWIDGHFGFLHFCFLQIKVSVLSQPASKLNWGVQVRASYQQNMCVLVPANRESPTSCQSRQHDSSDWAAAASLTRAPLKATQGSWSLDRWQILGQDDRMSWHRHEIDTEYADSNTNNYSVN